MSDYDLIMVLSPEVDEATAQATVERVKRFVSQKGGAVTHEELRGRRRLGHPIDKYTEGNYILTRLQMKPADTGELNNTLNVTEGVLRYLLVKRDKKPHSSAGKEKAAAGQ